MPALPLERAAAISTPAGFMEALRLGIVSEVAPTLFATIGPADAFLTREGRMQAWVMGSASLYNLLVLNQRWPVSAAEAEAGALISQKALVGLGRIVGFDLQKPSDLTASVLVFMANPEGSNHGELGEPLVPTAATFAAEIEALRPATASPIPAEIFQDLKQIYDEATATGSTPVEVFAAISGRGAEPDPWRQAIYDAAVEAIRQGGWPPPTAEGVARFFNDFAEPIQTEQQPGWQEALLIGVRALLSETFRASPLWSSLGIGFAPAANPLVGLPAAELVGDARYAGQELLVNNVQYRAITSGDLFDESLIWDLVTGPPTERIDPTEPYLSDGWFSLAPAIRLRPGITPVQTLPSRLDEYRWSAEITASGTVVAFAPDSLSSDTISAAMAQSWGRQLTPSTRVSMAFSDLPATAWIDRITGIPLQALPGLIHDQLPSTFATYIAAGGGIDAITGSAMSDVVVGPSNLAAHGQLRVDGGAGDDLIAPGRGGSLVRLGPGLDQLVFDAGNLFGNTVLLDFSGLEDRVVLDAGIITSGLGTPLLTLTNPLDASFQTVLLSGTSDPQWQADWLEFV